MASEANARLALALGSLAFDRREVRLREEKLILVGKAMRLNRDNPLLEMYQQTRIRPNVWIKFRWERSGCVIALEVCSGNSRQMQNSKDEWSCVEELKVVERERERE